MHRTGTMITAIACAAATLALCSPGVAPAAVTTTVPPVTSAVPPATTPQTSSIPAVTQATTAPTTSQTITIPAQGAGTSAAGSARSRSTTGGGLSTAAILLAVIAGLIALCALIWAVARMRAYEPRWLLSMRHSMGEAGMRMSATFDELKDWARLGR